MAKHAPRKRKFSNGRKVDADLRTRKEPLPPRQPKEESAGSRAADSPDDPSPPQGDFLATALDRAMHAHLRERENIAQGYEDLEFLAGDQWPLWAKQEREDQERPIMVMNICDQYHNQVAGEIETQRPSLKVIPIDARGKAEIAQLIAGMIRYIENRSEAQAAYMHGADQQIGAGIGHWRVQIEYADQTTFNKELRIVHIEDGVSVLWDQDAILPDRSDAMWCLVPVDLSREKFKKKYPHVPVESFIEYDKRYQEYWLHDDLIRVAEYWERREVTRKLAIFDDGSIDDVTDADEASIAACKQRGAEIVEREGRDVYRSLITIGHVLEEPEKQKGRYIPIVPAIGREIHIGKRRVRKGIIRNLKDPQRLLNFTRSSQAELVGLAPKAPWLGTEKNFENNPDKWDTANRYSYPTLEYVPDPLNNGVAPQRNFPQTQSAALSELGNLATQDTQAVTGIYPTSLGAKSNETSGKAIDARVEQADVGTFRYVTNFSLAVRHTGRILVDLIPHVYDTERMVHAMNRAGEIEPVWINKAQGITLAPEDPDEADADIEGAEDGKGDGDEADATGIELAADEASDRDRKKVGRNTPLEGERLNDVTIGAYGIAIDTGTRYADAKEEAKNGMKEFITDFPPAAPLISDLYVKAQEWPLADEIAERLRIMLPPPIQALIAASKNKGAGQIGPNGMPIGPNMPIMPPQPEPPPPGEVAAQQAAVTKAQADAEIARLRVEEKRVELQIKQLDFQMAQAGGMVTPKHIQTLTEELARHRGMIHELAASTAHVTRPGAQEDK